MPDTFEVVQVNDQNMMNAAMALRMQVFVQEQGIASSDEIDSHEDESSHYLIRKKSTREPVGTTRWRVTPGGCKLERFCILPRYRRQGAGTQLLQQVIADISKTCPQSRIYLNAQESALFLYEKQGFITSGPMFLECNIPHYTMIYSPDTPPEN